MTKMIDIATERVFPLSRAPHEAQNLPSRRRGKKIHGSTFFRWAKDGVRGVRLETIRVGGTLCTSVEALQRFFNGLTPASDPAGSSAPQTATARRRAEATERALDALGV